MSTLATLRALYATIGSALDDIERTYGKQGLDFPSPDIPFYRNSPDSSKDANADAAEKLRNEPAVAKSINFIVAACGQLSTAVNNPFFNLMEVVSWCHVTAAVQVLEQSHAVEILHAAGPDGLHVQELARKIDDICSGKDPISEPLDPSKLAHILRLLATHHLLREVRPDVFAINRSSSLLDSGKTPQQLREAPEQKYDDTDRLGAAALVAMCAGEPFRSMSYLSEWLLSPREGTKYATPFNYAYQTEEQFYAWLERPENALRLAQVGRAMNAARLTEREGEIADNSVFPWADLPQDALIVDVGGGTGSVSVHLALAHPHLRFVVEDRAQTIALAPTVWGAKHPELFSTGRIVYQEQDFFTPQPPAYSVPGVGDIPTQRTALFILARVMHNWPDEGCTRILAKLREVAGAETRLMIVEQILQPVCADPDGADPGAVVLPTDSPLLPNLGKAAAKSYHFDLTMMVMMNSKERSVREFAALAREAGWKIERVARTEGGMWAYITLAPV